MPTIARVPTRATDADAALFTGPHVLIDKANQCVGLAATTADARAAVRAGRAATWASQLAAGVAAIDLDLDHEGLALHLVDEFTRWATRRGLWCASRPSGGGPGRWHVIIVVGRHSAALDELVDAARADAHLSPRQVDRRRTIRPLAAPHRSGSVTVATLPASSLKHAFRSAGAILSDPGRAQHPRVTPTRAPGRLREPYELNATSRSCPSRSEREFGITVQLANQGVTEESAWRFLDADKGSKAHQKGRTWWGRHMWQRIRPRAARRTLDYARTILPIVAAYRPRYSDLDTRRRHTLEAVLLVILARIERSATGSVPVSQRDLWLCTGVRPGAARRAAQTAVELGILSSHRDRRRDAATTYELTPEALSLIDSSTLTPSRPQAHAAPWHWLSHLPPGSASTFLDAQLASPTRPASTRQRQLHNARTAGLLARGLLPHSAPQSLPLADDAERWAGRLAEVTRERDEFYAELRADRHRREQEWIGRVLRRRQRQVRWWAQLTQEERDQRRAKCRRRLAGMAPAERADHVHQLGERRRYLRELGKQFDAIEPLPLPLPSALP